MPKIREYSSQASQSGQGLSSSGGQSMSSIRQEGQANRELFGAVVGTADAVFEREAQIELSDLNAKFAEARSEWQTRIDEDTRNGSINTQKIQEDYQDFVSKMNEGITTAKGRSFFERQSSSLGGYVLKNAARGQAMVAGAKAEQDWKQALTISANSLQKDPSNFNDIHADTIEAIDAQVEAGAIPASIADKFKAQTGHELAKNAMRGMIDQSPYRAKQELNKGTYDKYLDPDTKAALANSADAAIAQAENKLLKLEALKSSNPWGFLAKSGNMGGYAPLDVSANDGGASFLRRQEFTKSMNKKYGINLPFMPENEAKAISKQLLQQDPDISVDMFQRLDANIKDDSQKAPFAMELFKKEPAMAAAMMMSAEAPGESSKILHGMQLLRPSSDGKAPVAAPSQDKVAQAFDEYVGSAISQPAARAAARQAVMAHFVKTRFDQNDLDFKNNMDGFDDSVNAILGPRIESQGLQTLGFRGKGGQFLDEDEFTDLVHSLDNEIIFKTHKQVPVTLRGESIDMSKSAHRIGLEAVGDGLYYMYMDGNKQQVLLAPGGTVKRPFVLNLKAVYETPRTEKDPLANGSPLGVAL